MSLSSSGSAAADAAQAARNSHDGLGDRSGRAPGGDFASILGASAAPPAEKPRPAQVADSPRTQAPQPARTTTQAATDAASDTPSPQAAAAAAGGTPADPAKASGKDAPKGGPKDKVVSKNSGDGAQEAADGLAAQQAVLAQLLAAAAPAAPGAAAAGSSAEAAGSAAVSLQTPGGGTTVDAQASLAPAIALPSGTLFGAASAGGSPKTSDPAATQKDAASLALLGSTGQQDKASTGGSDPGQAGDGKGGLFESLKSLVGTATVPSEPSGFTPFLANQLTVAATAAAATAAPATDTTAATPRLHETVGSERWANELGTRLTVMAAQGDQSGSLRLSPEHLGPLEVQIKITDDKASVWFGAQHADTRSALQDALPRLREMFSASGMQLADAGVSRQAPRQNPTPSTANTVPGFRALDAAEDSVAAVRARSVSHVGLLDTYA